MFTANVFSDPVAMGKNSACFLGGLTLKGNLPKKKDKRAPLGNSVIHFPADVKPTSSPARVTRSKTPDPEGPPQNHGDQVVFKPTQARNSGRNSGNSLRAGWL